MDTIEIKVRLENTCANMPRVLEVNALVDPSAFHLCLPVPLVLTLGLKQHGFRLVELPDGSTKKCRHVGPVTLQCGSDLCFCGAVEHGDEVLLGSLPLNALALALDLETWPLVSVPVRV